MANIVILGAGMMGSALSVPFMTQGHRVRLVGTHLDSDIIDALRRDSVHPKLRAKLPDGIEFYRIEELDRALEGVDAIALGVSSAGVPWAARTLSPFLADGLAKRRPPILMIAKGLTWTGRSLEVLPDTFRRGLEGDLASHVSPVAVGGPCIAGELARKVPTCVLIAGRNLPSCQTFAHLMGAPYYYAKPTSDIVGVEVCAALKNAYAMGVGLAAGLHERSGGAPGSVAMHNFESAVFAQAVLEMQALVEELGGNPQTAVGLAGAGDLTVTCNGGRTGRFGRLLGLGLSLEEAVARMEGATLECLDILAVMRAWLASRDPQVQGPRPHFPLLRFLGALVEQGSSAKGPVCPEAMPFPAFFGG